MEILDVRWTMPIAQPIEQISDFSEIKNRNERNKAKIAFRREREDWWMKELWTVVPYGMNEKCDGKRWNERGPEESSVKILHPIADTFHKERKIKDHQKARMLKDKTNKKKKTSMKR